jgi:hypothetical protein
MTNQIQILTAVAAILVALERALSKGVIGPTMTPKWKAFWLVAVIGPALTIANAVIAGDTWSTAALATLATVATPAAMAALEAMSEWWTWKKSLKAPKTPSVSTTVGTGLLVLLLSGCAGSLQTARNDALAPRLTSVAGVPLKSAPPPSERCVQLDNRYVVWGGAALAAEALAGAGGLVSIPIEDKTGKVVMVTVAVVCAAVGGGMAFVSQQAATSWARECSAQ